MKQLKYRMLKTLGGSHKPTWHLNPRKKPDISWEIVPQLPKFLKSPNPDAVWLLLLQD